MKPKGFWWEDWEVGPYTDFVIEIDADEGKLLSVAGHSSSSIWVAVEPIKSETSCPVRRTTPSTYRALVAYPYLSFSNTSRRVNVSEIVSI